MLDDRLFCQQQYRHTSDLTKMKIAQGMEVHTSFMIAVPTKGLLPSGHSL